jgi:hypothetical protein
MIGIFLVFEVMEPQKNYMEELYDSGNNSHGCFIVTFSTLHIYFIYIKHVYFVTLMK